MDYIRPVELLKLIDISKKVPKRFVCYSGPRLF